MNYTQIEIEDRFEGRLKIAYLNQPDAYNALNKTLLKELPAFLKECDHDEKVRCVAISGRGKAFCSGQNLKEAIGLAGANKEDAVVKKMVLDYYNPLVLAIVNNSKPVIALVNGAAVGAGANLALICDFALATKSAYFSQGFVNIGLIPDTAGTWFLPKLVGRQTANYLAVTGKRVDAEEAKQLGMIADFFEDQEFETKANEILKQICSLPTQSIALTKKAFHLSYQNSLEEQLEFESVIQQKASETEDFKEGITAFLEKRKPEYKGK